jgi:hypothetical protein
MTFPMVPGGWSTSVLPSWLDTEWLLPADVRTRIREAADAARQLQSAIEVFASSHWGLFQEYADLADRAGPPDVWEVLDQSSGYSALWVSLLMSEAVLATALDVVRPSGLSERPRRRYDRS